MVSVIFVWYPESHLQPVYRILIWSRARKICLRLMGVGGWVFFLRNRFTHSWSVTWITRLIIWLYHTYCICECNVFANAIYVQYQYCFCSRVSTSINPEANVNGVCNINDLSRYQGYPGTISSAKMLVNSSYLWSRKWIYIKHPPNDDASSKRIVKFSQRSTHHTGLW